MAQAILEGRKTVTRRVIKYSSNTNPNATLDDFAKTSNDWDFVKSCCPYQAGDILWVRETWAEQGVCILYKANFTDEEIAQNGYWFEPGQINWCELPKWRPSIHMPLEAARLFLRVKSVRVERLQEIDNAGAKAEGVTAETDNSGKMHRSLFVRLWNSIIKPAKLPLYGWDANPWVWVIEFERMTADD